MLAGQLTRDDAGQDLTLTVGGICTGGIIRSVNRFAGMVTVDLDGQLFTVDEEKEVALTAVDIRQLIVTERDPELRRIHIETLDLLSRQAA